MSHGNVRRTTRLFGLAALASVILLSLSSAQAAGTAASTSLLPTQPFVKADSSLVGVFAVSIVDNTGAGTLTDFDVRLTAVTGFSSGDIRVDTTAAGCNDTTIPAVSLGTGCDGVALWRDDGTVDDAWDAGDTPVSAGFTFPAGNDCSVGATPCDVDLTLTGSDAPFPLPTAAEGSGTFLVSLRTSSSIADGNRFTIGLQPTGITTAPAPTLCCTGTASTSIEADTVAPASPDVTAVGVSRGAGVVHHLAGDVSAETDTATLQVYSSASDTCSPLTFVAESSAQDLTANNNRDLPGFDAAALKAYPQGDYVCYRVKDRAANYSSFVSDGLMPAQPTAANLAALSTSNVTGAKQVNAIPGAVQRFRMHIKPGNAGEFVRARNGSNVSHDQWIEILTSASVPTCSLDPGTTTCTTGIAQYQNTGMSGATLAEGDGVGYSIATDSGNDGTPLADGTIPAAPTGDTGVLSVSAANDHQRLIHAGGAAGSIYGLYIDTSGLGTTFRRAVDQSGAFVTVTSAAGQANSGTTAIHSETATGPALDAGDNVAYVAVSAQGNVSATTVEGTIPAVRDAAELSFSDAANTFTWAPTGGVFPANTSVRAFAGSTAGAAYGTGTALGEATSAASSPSVAEQAGGLGVFYTTVNTSNGHESPTLQDGTIPVAPIAADLALLGTSAASGHQRVSATQDSSARTFGLYVDTTGVGNAFTRATTQANGSTAITITTSTTGPATSNGTPGSQSAFAGATQLAGAHAVGYSQVASSSGNDSDVVGDATIPAAPVAANGRVSDAADTFLYSGATTTLRARLHTGGSTESASAAYSQAGPDKETTSSSVVAIGSDPADGASVYYTISNALNGNESETVADGVLPTSPGSALDALLSVSAAQFNQRLIAGADASQPRTFRLYVDAPSDPPAWTGAVTASNGSTPVQVTTAATATTSGTITIFAGSEQLSTAWPVGYALVNANDHDSEVEDEFEIPDPVVVAEAVARASIDQVEVSVIAQRTARLYSSTSSDMNTAYDEGVDATIDSTDPTVSVNLSGGDNIFYTSTSTLSGHESIMTADGVIPQPIAASTTQASDALDRFVAPSATTALPVKALVDASSDATTAYGSPDYVRTITASPDNVGADLPSGFLYYYVYDAALSSVAGGGNESPITSVDQIPAMPDVASLMSASAALGSITSAGDASPGRVLRLYVDADGPAPGGFVRASTTSGGTSPVQLTTASTEVTSAAGIFAGASPLSAGAVTGYSRVLGPNGQNDSDYQTDGDIPVAPADSFTADASANASTILAAAPSGTYRVFRDSGTGFTAVSVKRTHTNGTATSVAYSTANAFAAGNAVGYAQTNVNGNESSVLQDSIIPNVATPDLQAGSDAGFDNTDNITNVTAPLFDVAADSGASVTLYEGASTLGNATAAAGVATITSSTLTSTTHAITAKSVQNGNTSPVSAPLNVTVDTTAPAAPVSAPDLQAESDTGRSGDPLAASDNLTNIQQPVFNITGIAGGAVTLYRVPAVGSPVVLGTSPADGSGLGSVTSSILSDGAHTVKASTTDAAGNESALTVSSLSVTIDTVAPAVPQAPDLEAASDSNVVTDDVTADATPSFLVHGNDADTRVSLIDNAVARQTEDTAPGGSVAVTLPSTADGVHSIAATSTDRAANQSAESSALSVTIDTTAPATPASAPDLLAASDSGSSTTDDITSDVTPTFATAGSEASSVVTLLSSGAATGTTQAADGSGNATLTAGSLADGSRTMSFTSTDLAGNVSAASAALSVVIDTVAPSTPGSAPDLLAASDSGSSATDDLTNDFTPSFATAGSEAGSVVTLLSGGVATGTTQTADSSGDATVTAGSLADGSHTMSFTSTDLAGNASAAAAGLAIVVDTVLPAAPAVPDLQIASDSGRSQTDNVTNDNSPSFDVTGTEAAATVRLLVGTTQLATGTADGAGAVTLTSPALVDATRDVVAEATDAAGNVAALSPALSVTIDTVKPAAPSAPDLTSASDSGSSAFDNITNDATPAIAVASEANASVTVLDGATGAGSAITDGTGAGTVTTTTLTDGSHSLTITGADLAGNISDPSAALGVLIDTVAPTATLTPVTALTGASKAVLSEDVGSVNASQLVLRLTGATTGLPANAAYSAATKTATLVAKAALIPGQRYELVLVPAGAIAPKDVAGNPVATTLASFRASRIEQEFSPAVKQGWRIVGTSSAYGGSYATEHLAGARAWMSFSGSEVRWHSIAGPGQGKAQVLIDGVSKGIFNNYASSTQYRTTRTFTGLATNKTHTITVIVLGQKGSTSASDSQVAVDAFTVRYANGQLSTIVSPQLGYGWRIVSATNASGGKYITSDQPGSAVSFTFRGNGVAWLAYVGPSMGRAQVYIDGFNKGVVDLYFSRSGQATKWFGGLSDSVHTIRIVALGTRNVRSTGNQVTADRFTAN